jgi:hypothetical protein
MGRRKKVISPNAGLYTRTDSFTMPDGRVIEKDEIIKIHGEWGGKFKFTEYVVRNDTRVDWIDCFEVRGGVLCGWRSFRTDRIRPMPKRKNRKKI